MTVTPKSEGAQWDVNVFYRPRAYPKLAVHYFHQSVADTAREGKERATEQALATAHETRTRVRQELGLS